MIPVSYSEFIYLGSSEMLCSFKPTRSANNNPSILDHIWSNQLYDTFNGIFLLDITHHYPIFTIVPINCPQERIRVKFKESF